MSVRVPAAILLAFVLMAAAMSMAGLAGRSSGGTLLIPNAQAQSAVQSLFVRLRRS